ncbi:MAG: hypothetical protein ACKVP0_16900 [Pirellulaceae bacterium]
MNSDQRKSFRIQISDGQEHACLTVGKREIKARILDESAGGFAVALLEEVEVQQNQMHLLKTSVGLFQTRIARIEHFADGKLLGLVRLSDLSEEGIQAPQAASWRDCLMTPPQSGGSGASGLAVGIGMAVVLGILVCGLAVYGIRYLPAQRSPGNGQLARDFAEAVTGEIEKAREAAVEAERIAREKSAAAKGSVAARTPEYVQQQARVSAEVLFRLQLTADQSRRIRDILHRSSGDLASAEAEIRSVLTSEQAKRWRSLAP